MQITAALGAFDVGVTAPRAHRAGGSRVELFEAQTRAAEAAQLRTGAEQTSAPPPETAHRALADEPGEPRAQTAEPVPAPAIEGCPEPPVESSVQVGPADVLQLALVALEEQVARFHERSARSEEIIREMQSRITALQGDQVQALLRPAIQRFAGLHSQAAEAHRAALERGEAASADFSFFMTAIEDALGLLDLDSVGASVGVAFDPARHHATGRISTGDRSLDKTVQRVVRQGFTYTGAARVSIPAQVIVYQLDESLASAAPAARADEAKYAPEPNDAC